MTTRIVNIWGLFVAGWLLAFLPISADAALPSQAVGTNTELDSLNGKLFIPFLPADSGRLGDLVPGGRVGFQSDHVTRTGIDSTFSGGNVSFLLNYDLSSGLNNPQATLSQPDTQVVFTFTDLDFANPGTVGNWLYKETMNLTVLAKNGNPLPSNPAGLLIDSSNYQAFNGGHAVTNNTTLSYTFNLASDLNLSAADFAQIEADKGVSIDVTLNSLIKHNRTGTGSFFNTDESVASHLVYLTTVGAVPEPATLSFLVLGGLVSLGAVVVRGSRSR